MRTLRLVALVTLAACVLAALAGANAGANPPKAPLQISAVGRLAFPERGYVVDLPVGAAITANRVHVSENGIGIGDFQFSALSASGVSYGTVLAIDTSDSMKGVPEAGALAAARTFVARRTPNQRIGVVTFNGTVDVLQPLTSDGQTLHDALAKPPRLAYATHLFDAVRSSLQLLAKSKISAGSIVLLSDGADIGSTSKLPGIVAAARRQHVRVFTVGLSSGAYDPNTLRSIAQETHGAYAEAASVAKLGGIYSSLGTKLSREYLLAYRSLAAPGATVDVRVTLDGVGTQAARYLAPKPSELPPYHRPFIRSFFLSGWSLLLLALLIAALAALTVRLILDASRSRVVDRIRAFAGNNDAPPIPQVERKRQEAWRRRASRARASGATAARGWLQRLDEQLDIGRISASTTTILSATVLGTLLVIVVLAAISPIFAVLGLATPLLTRSWVRWRVRKIRDEFAEQLPPNLQVLASGLRAGFTLLGALVATVENATEPSKSELDRAVKDEQLGVPLEEAVRRVASRMDSRDLDQVAMLAELLRTTGGNAAEVLDVIVFTVRERHDIRRLVRTLTTQGRMARWILTALPIATCLGFWALQPDIVGPTWHTTLGQVALLIAAVMVGAGSFVIQKIVEIEV